MWVGGWVGEWVGRALPGPQTTPTSNNIWVWFALRCSKSKQCTEIHSYDHVPVTRGYIFLGMAVPRPRLHKSAQLRGSSKDGRYLQQNRENFRHKVSMTLFKENQRLMTREYMRAQYPLLYGHGVLKQ